MTQKTDQLQELARKFPNGFVESKDGNSYVAHHIVNQRLLQVVGPYDFELVEVIRSDVPAVPPDPKGRSKRAQRGTPALHNAVTGGIWRLTVTINDRKASIEEVGDVGDVHNWPHDGARLKDAASDALKRCAMRLGLGLHLWAQEHYFLDQQLKADAEAAAKLEAEVAAKPNGNANGSAAPAAEYDPDYTGEDDDDLDDDDLEGDPLGEGEGQEAGSNPEPEPVTPDLKTPDLPPGITTNDVMRAAAMRAKAMFHDAPEPPTRDQVDEVYRDLLDHLLKHPDEARQAVQEADDAAVKAASVAQEALGGTVTEEPPGWDPEPLTEPQAPPSAPTVPVRMNELATLLGEHPNHLLNILKQEDADAYGRLTVTKMFLLKGDDLAEANRVVRQHLKKKAAASV